MITPSLMSSLNSSVEETLSPASSSADLASVNRFPVQSARSTGAGPLDTTKSTGVSRFTWVPAATDCEMTIPFLTLSWWSSLIVPDRRWPSVRSCSAFSLVCPSSFGTDTARGRATTRRERCHPEHALPLRLCACHQPGGNCRVLLLERDLQPRLVGDNRGPGLVQIESSGSACSALGEPPAPQATPRVGAAQG